MFKERQHIISFRYQFYSQILLQGTNFYCLSFCNVESIYRLIWKEISSHRLEIFKLSIKSQQQETFLFMKPLCNP